MTALQRLRSAAIAYGKVYDRISRGRGSIYAYQDAELALRAAASAYWKHSKDSSKTRRTKR